MSDEAPKVDETPKTDESPKILTQPPLSEFFHHVFDATMHGVHKVEIIPGLIVGQFHVMDYSNLYKSIQPEFKTGIDKLLPAALAEGEKAIADLIQKEHWERIANFAGPITAAFVQGLFARIAAPIVTVVASS